MIKLKLNQYDDSRLNTLTLEQQANFIGFLQSLNNLSEEKLEEVIKELIWQNIKLRESANRYANKITELTGHDPCSLPPELEDL